MKLTRRNRGFKRSREAVISSLLALSASLFLYSKVVGGLRELAFTTKPLNVHYILTQYNLTRNTTCDLPSLQVLVLTANRPESLKRLLQSLAEADYGCAHADLQVNIDLPVIPGQENIRCIEEAAAIQWKHGRKTIQRRVSHAGLSQSWFEAPYFVDDHEYIAIFEDDMQVSRHFFSFFSMLVRGGSLASNDVAALCLHPNDWEVDTHLSCSNNFSPFLYLSPEPCNWGPIWKYAEWRRYIDWVFAAKAAKQLPYVEGAHAYNYNKYLKQGRDVQSPWVWRYNHDFKKRHLRYSFIRCDHGRTTEIYFAINHKEPGVNFQRKFDIDNDPNFLIFDFMEIIRGFSRAEFSFLPAPFPGYDKWAKSLHG